MRQSLDKTMMQVARILATRATCSKRQVGCVLTDKAGRIIGSGYNGVPSGATHCTDVPCAGALQPTGSDTCLAVHAEMNAALNCRDVQSIETVYCTVAPCNTCLKTLLNTSATRLVFAAGELPPAATIWLDQGRTIAMELCEQTGHKEQGK